MCDHYNYPVTLLTTPKKRKKKTEKPEELRFESPPGYNIIIFPWPRLREKWLKSFSRNVFDWFMRPMQMLSDVIICISWEERK